MFRWLCTRWVWLFIGALIIMYLKTRYFTPPFTSCLYSFLHILSSYSSSTVLSPVSSQPVQLSAELEGLLLSMCEDMAVRRTDLLTVLETCELHHKASMLPPAERLIRQLVEDVYKNLVSVGSVLFSAGQRSHLVLSSFSSASHRWSSPHQHCLFLCRSIMCPWLKTDRS